MNIFYILKIHNGADNNIDRFLEALEIDTPCIHSVDISAGLCWS